MMHKISLVCFVGVLAWAYIATQPPRPKICGFKDGSPVTAPRVQLKDGVEIVESRGNYIVSFDRHGYGESDSHPDRTLNSTAFDIEELADQLGLGPKFYVLGFSMGGQIAWTCLKYIPHRLAGAGLIPPAINFWWGGIPSSLSGEAFGKQFLSDQWALRVAHYAPWLTYWWNTQKLFPGSSVIAENPLFFSGQDIQLMSKRLPLLMEYTAQTRQQGEFESIHRDAIIGFGKWEFDPTELRYPFSETGIPGDEDIIVPVTLPSAAMDSVSRDIRCRPSVSFARWNGREYCTITCRWKELKSLKPPVN